MEDFFFSPACEHEHKSFRRTWMHAHLSLSNVGARTYHTGARTHVFFFGPFRTHLFAITSDFYKMEKSALSRLLCSSPPFTYILFLFSILFQMAHAHV